MDMCHPSYLKLIKTILLETLSVEEHFFMSWEGGKSPQPRTSITPNDCQPQITITPKSLSPLSDCHPQMTVTLGLKVHGKQ